MAKKKSTKKSKRSAGGSRGSGRSGVGDSGVSGSSGVGVGVEVREVDVGKINPAPYNPRVALRPGDPAYRRLKRAIETFGCVEPLVWNKRSGNLVGGHQRLEVLKREYQVEAVQVSVVDLAPESEKQLNLALNKVEGAWDNQKLAGVLAELQDLEMDIHLAGFETDEAERLVEKYLDGAGEQETPFAVDHTPAVQVQVNCENKTQADQLVQWLRGKGYGEIKQVNF